MAQPKRDNCCRAWLSKFPTRYDTLLTTFSSQSPSIFILNFPHPEIPVSPKLFCHRREPNFLHKKSHFPIPTFIPISPHKAFVLLVVCSCSLASFTSFCSKQIKLVVVIVARTHVVDFVVVDIFSKRLRLTMSDVDMCGYSNVMICI